MVNFGEKLNQERIPRFSAQYLDYDKLRRLISKCKAELEEDDASTFSVISALKSAERQNRKGLMLTKSDNSLAEFVYQLEADLSKVNGFSVGRFKELKTHITDLVHQVQSASVCDNSEEGDLDLEFLEDSAEQFSKRLIELHKFIQQNAVGFQKIAKKLDKEVPHIKIRSWIEIRVQREPFITLPLSKMLVPLSDVYNFIRDQESQKTRAKWEPPQDFQRQTTKYWVPLEYAFETKVAIMKHLPILIYDRGDDDDSEGDNILDLRDSNWISSVYFDNEQGQVFHERVHRQEKARLVRLRFYGDNPDRKDIFIEQKIHHESWVQAESLKERFSLRPDVITKFLKGELDVDKYYQQLVEAGKISERSATKSVDLAKRVLAFIQEYKLKPMIRTCYRRSAFQRSDNNAVRITFDIDLQMIDEYAKSSLETGHWCLPSTTSGITIDDIFSFPHGILEVKLQDNPPPWLDELLRRGYIVQADKFSKFLTSMAIFHPDFLKVLPPWMNEPSLVYPLTKWGYPKDSSFSSLVKVEQALAEKSNSIALKDRTKKKKPKMEDSLPSDIEKGLSGRPLPKVLEAIPKVEPKTYFANERTFIQWLSAAILIVTLSMILINIGNQNAFLTGISFFPVAIVFMIYALGQFYWRAKNIRSLSPTGYFDPYGPGLLVICLVISMIATLVILATHQANIQDNLMIQLDQVDSLEWNLELTSSLTLNKTCLTNIPKLTLIPQADSYHNFSATYFGTTLNPQGQYYIPESQGKYSSAVIRFREFPDLSEKPELTLKFQALREPITKPIVSQMFKSQAKNKLETQFIDSSHRLDWSTQIESWSLPNNFSLKTLEELSGIFTNLNEQIDIPFTYTLENSKFWIQRQTIPILYKNQLVKLQLESKYASQSEGQPLEVDLDFKLEPDQLSLGSDLSKELVNCL